MTNDEAVHLVIPCFRESGRLGPFLEDLCREAEKLQPFTVLVVDDGSEAEEQDRMRQLLAPFMERYSFLRAIYLEKNVGKGAAVYAGWDRHEGQRWLGFVDADGSVPAEEVARLLRIGRDRGTSAGAIFSSRVMMLGRAVQRRLHRHLIGRMYATIVSVLLRVPVYDSQCGFKLVPNRAFQAIAPALSTCGFAFDAELLVALLDSGCPVREEPIDWHEVAGGKVRLLRDPWRMTRDMLRIKRRRASPAWLQHMAALARSGSIQSGD